MDPNRTPDFDASTKLDNQQVRRVGEHYVAAELHRRGAYAITFSGNMPENILASDLRRTRTVSIQVKTKTAGTWQTSTRRGRPRDEELGETEFWIFVDIGKNPDTRPTYYIAPAWWIENSIHAEHEAYIARHGGKRARTPTSTHHAIPANRLTRWRDRWDLLRIF